MSEPLKTVGVKELRAVRKRAIRQRSLGRISQHDCDYILDRLREVEARIINMTEQDRSGKEL